MTLRKTLNYVLPAMLAVGIAGQAQANIFFPNFGEVEKKSYSGSSFTNELAREYHTMTLYEWNEMRDYADAEYYASKALMAGEDGKAPAPSNPANWNIGEAAQMQELKVAHGELVKALQAGAPTIAPRQAAVAQARFDCWVEQQEEGWQFAEIAACREQFRTAMGDLNEAMKPKPAVSAVPAQNATLVSTNQNEIDRTVIYFGFDRSNITPESRTELNRFIADMRGQDDINIYIEGHTDTSGDSDYNQKLSERRAQAVRDVLDREGLPLAAVDQIRVEGTGQEELAVATANGVREPLNRRVVVIARGVSQTTRIQPPTN